MRKILILLMLAVPFLKGCSKSDHVEKEQTVVIAERSDVKTFQVISLISDLALADKYQGTFGNASIELIKTSDTTLVFSVPNVESGDYVLDFELSKLNFKVTKTTGVEPEKLVTDIFKTFDDRMAALNPVTEAEIREFNDIKKYKDEVIAMFNALSPAQKQEMALFYEANKESFKTFTNDIYTTYNAGTNMRTQSDCPRNEFREFYGCTASNLGTSAVNFTASLKSTAGFVGLGYLSASLAPASFGLGAAAATIAFTTAAYLLITEVRPAAQKFGSAVFPFLEANWLLSKGLFLYAQDQFTSDASIDLNLKPAFRSLNSTDQNVNTGTSSFINSFSALAKYWAKFTTFFGAVPQYKATEAPTTLAASEIKISDISNTNVQLVSQSNQNITFKSVSGKEETFKYRIIVSKQGFADTTTLTAKVTVSSLKIGDIHAGGIIFHLDATKMHGFVVSQEAGIMMKWDSTKAPNGAYSPVTIGGTGNAMGTGATNTQKIIAAIGTNAKAAQFCRNYRGGGFTDWFLPSLDEVSTFYDVLKFSSGVYWSSSEYTDGGLVYAYMYSYNGTHQMNRVSFDAKYNERRVLPVRAF